MYVLISACTYNMEVSWTDLIYFCVPSMQHWVTPKWDTYWLFDEGMNDWWVKQHTPCVSPYYQEQGPCPMYHCSMAYSTGPGSKYWWNKLHRIKWMILSGWAHQQHPMIIFISTPLSPQSPTWTEFSNPFTGVIQGLPPFIQLPWFTPTLAWSFWRSPTCTK